MGVVTFLGGIIVDRLFLGNLRKEISENDTIIIADLEKIREIMTKLEEIRSAGQLDLRNIWRDDKLDDMFQDVLTLLGKHRKLWVYVDESTPNDQRAKRVREEANKSIGLIRTHGHKKAKKIREEELRGSDKKPWSWDEHNLQGIE